MPSMIESSERAKKSTMDLMTDELVALLLAGVESFLSGLALIISGVTGSIDEMKLKLNYQGFK